MYGLTVIDVLSFTVGVLGLLTSVLIGWQIYQAVYIERIVKRKIERKIKEYDVVIEKKLAAQQAELLTAMMTITLNSGDYNMTLLMASYIPSQMERANAVSENNLAIEIEKIEQSISRADKCGFQLSDHSLQRVIEAYEVYSKYSSVRDFVSVLRQRQNNQNHNA